MLVKMVYELELKELCEALGITGPVYDMRVQNSRLILETKPTPGLLTRDPDGTIRAVK